MKKIALILFTFCFFLSHAQSFYKGALVTNVNYGIDIYNVKEHLVYKGPGTTSEPTKDTADKAGCMGLRLGAEYGVLDWLGLGVSGKINNYITSADKKTGIKPAATGGEIGLLVNFHMVRKNKFDLVGGFDLGYSHFRFNSRDSLGTMVSGNGPWFNLHISPRLYFGRFGINMALNFPFISYANLVSTDPNFNKNYSFSWKASGWGLNFGIQYRFLKAK